MARSKAYQEAVEAPELQWPNPDGFSSPAMRFLPNITPETYCNKTPVEELPPLVSAEEPQSSLFDGPVAPPTSSKRRNRRRNKKQPEGHIPRPPNAFILFRGSFVRTNTIPEQVESSHNNLSKIAKEVWDRLPENELEIWIKKALIEKEEHRRKYPDYVFRPVHTKEDKEAKRVKNERKKKQKEQEQDTFGAQRHKVIASLFLNGIRGDDLNNALNAWDYAHAQPITPCFEAPLTASNFRRDSITSVGGGGENDPSVLTSESSRKRKRPSPKANASAPSFKVHRFLASSASVYSSPTMASTSCETLSSSSFPETLRSSPFPEAFSPVSSDAGLPVEQASFDMSSFTWGSNSQPAYSQAAYSHEAVDPFTPNDSLGLGQPPLVPSVVERAPLHIDTSFSGTDWSSSDYSSPYSSIPGTPQSFTVATHGWPEVAPSVELDTLPPIMGDVNAALMPYVDVHTAYDNGPVVHTSCDVAQQYVQPHEQPLYEPAAYDPYPYQQYVPDPESLLAEFLSQQPPASLELQLASFSDP